MSKYYRDVDEFVQRLGEAELARIFKTPVDELTDADLRTLRANGYNYTRAELEALEAELPPPPPSFMLSDRDVNRRQNDEDSLIHADPTPDHDKGGDGVHHLQKAKTFVDKITVGLASISDAQFWAGQLVDLEKIAQNVVARLDYQRSDTRPTANERRGGVENRFAGWMSRKD